MSLSFDGTRESPRSIIHRVLAADLCCDADDFVTSKTWICRAEIREGRLRFAYRENSLNIVTMGNGVVVSCSSDRIEWCREHLAPMEREQIFSVPTMAMINDYLFRDKQFLAGPDQKYLCSPIDLRPFSVPDEIEICIVQKTDLPFPHQLDWVHHALSNRSNDDDRDMLVAVATHQNMIIGVAGASADSDLIWQIGVDVIAGYKRKGVGKALVGTLTRSILDRGILPYYSTAVGNLPSRRLAISLGYYPAWVQLYAREIP